MLETLTNLLHQIYDVEGIIRWGGLLMLIAIVYTGSQYAAHSPRPSFLLADLERLTMPLAPQALCFSAFAIAFAIKMPLFPLHSWSPETYRDAPIGAVVMASALMASQRSHCPASASFRGLLR